MPKPDPPPAPQSKVTDSRHNRSRIRLELTVERANWLLGVIQRETANLDIDDREFRETFLIVKSIKLQMAAVARRGTAGPG